MEVLSTQLIFLFEDQKIITRDEIDQQFKPFEKKSSRLKKKSGIYLWL